MSMEYHRINANITDLPHHILERIFLLLPFRDLIKLKIVSHRFYVVYKVCVRLITLRILASIRKLMQMMKNYISKDIYAFDAKVKFNYTYTTLNILNFVIYSTYVLSRHYMIGKYGFLTYFGNVLDLIQTYLYKMEVNNCFRLSIALQNVITRLNIYNANYQNNKKFPFGVHIMDILDVIFCIDYDIECKYNLKQNECLIHAKYYTDYVKFLTYLPDIVFLKNCSDREITESEAESVYKYLIHFVNICNCSYCRADEYIREMELKSDLSDCFRSHMPICFHREYSTRKMLDNDNVLEVYKSGRSDSSCTNKLLNCKIILRCSMDVAPFHIKRSYKALQESLQLNKSNRDADDVCLDASTSKRDVYGAHIILQMTIHSRNKENIEIDIKQGVNVD